ncbi:BN860_01310g1_1 [Zygosaccharomyces bailii CLIB 213]|uniref:BN860_01310g1_1 n=1 Tax=Zygosaccharomyces bailii (strain CLIB 213 / ATCC 58445 / CBS 680 / BCRC 21525 / NBRC 1098 / NCYC 1416 / NRRL Y-2227) TaxID=1333698 RepID=A0A8J2T3F2_ZYGB2|nr:BN860_01310g1_1 [Zygosaccharomyces bailii CLIB 213]
MESVDSDFGPVRKAKVKVNSSRIIQDVSIDHDQSSLLKKITLLPIKRPLDKSPNENTLGTESAELSSPVNTKESNILSNIRLITKKARTNPINDNATSFKVEPLDPDFKRFKHYLLRHLYQTLPPEQTKPYSFLRETQQEINRHLKQSIVQKESHSSILVGPRKSFKTFLLNHELALLSEKFHQQFITIRLNGFIHSEQTAINGIATQLEQQLQTLHGQITKKEEDVNISSGSLTEVFEKILRLLDSAAVSGSHSKQNNTSKITVVFIFDEIDTFAGPVRQTLLYNLFDMVEHARVPVCIFGCTTKLNILEYLEKRVKSRFSQRIIYMPQIEDFHQFLSTTKEMLSPPSISDFKHVDSWNALVEKEILDPSSNIHRIVRINYETFRSIPYLRNGIIPLVFGARDYESLQDSFKNCDRLKMYNKNLQENSLTEKVKSLSNLELCILICAARTALKSKDETTNFNLVYAEYEEMIKSVNKKIPTVASSRINNDSTSVVFDNTVKIWKKRDIKNVWESLLALNFLTEKSAVGLRESAIAAFYASNYQFQGTTIPFDLRRYQSQVTLQGLRRIIPKSSMYYSWTQL